MSTLAEALRSEATKLATLREEAIQREQAIRIARDAFEQTIATQVNALAGLTRSIEATESAVRGMALVEYETSGSKKAVPGIEVVIGEELVYEEGAAWAWAQQTGLCVSPAKLDAKAFAKIAKAAPLPFVTKVPKPSVRIASDLLAKLSGSEPLPWDHQEAA